MKATDLDIGDCVRYRDIPGVRLFVICKPKRGWVFCEYCFFDGGKMRQDKFRLKDLELWDK